MRLKCTPPLLPSLQSERGTASQSCRAGHRCTPLPNPQNPRSGLPSLMLGAVTATKNFLLSPMSAPGSPPLALLPTACRNTHTEVSPRPSASPRSPVLPEEPRHPETGLQLAGQGLTWSQAGTPHML